MAFEFVEDDEQNTEITNILADETVAVGATLIPQDGTNEGAAKASRSLRERIHTFSTWYEHPVAAKVAKPTKKLSQHEVRLSELEWIESKLKDQLFDPNGTRDLDDVQEELASVQRDIRKCKGWTSLFRK
uniref:Uncharacterized protein n=1 Tax=Proboscia inermis TaxID=420281 RepID=A0A7S0BUF1_9STRA